MSHTPHSQHLDRGESNCIVCQRENEAELVAKEAKESIEALYVAYSAYHTPYANDWDNLSNAIAEVQRRGYGAVYIRAQFSGVANSDLLKMLQKTWGRNGTVGTHLPACRAVQGPFPRPLDRNECDCGCNEAQALLRSYGVE